MRHRRRHTLHLLFRPFLVPRSSAAAGAFTSFCCCCYRCLLLLALHLFVGDALTSTTVRYLSLNVHSPFINLRPTHGQISVPLNTPTSILIALLITSKLEPDYTQLDFQHNTSNGNYNLEKQHLILISLANQNYVRQTF